MERRRVSPTWLASLGFAVTAFAAMLLTVAVGRIVWLNAAAGSDVASLDRERAGVRFERLLAALEMDLSRHRLLLRTRGDPVLDAALLARIDREMRDAQSFVGALGAASKGPVDWQAIAHHRSIGSLLDYIYQIGGSSGVENDSDHTTQELGDMLFARIPNAMDEALHSDLLAENAQTRGAITIRDRVMLARLSEEMGMDFDLEDDDWTSILGRTPKLTGAPPRLIARYKADEIAYRERGRAALRDYLRNMIELPGVPSGSASYTRVKAFAAAAAALRINQDVADILENELAGRIQLVLNRNRYVYTAILLAAVMLVGIMLLIAELALRRDRLALREAKEESERLSVELARQRAERALQLTEAQFQAIFNGAAIGIAILDKQGTVLDANAVFRGIYGEDALGVLDGHKLEFEELIRGERNLFEFEHRVRTPDGQEAWTDSTVSLVRDEHGNPYLAICSFRDLTDLKRSERRMLHDMTHDTLTGLPNRLLFETKIREQFISASNSQAPFAVLFVDLDRFKDINQSLGHDAGDFVISQVAYRLRNAVDPRVAVSRLGSDEFALLVPQATDVLQVEVLARRLLGALSKPIALGNRSIFVSGSIGIALAGPSYQRGEDVMRDADIAMRHAKGGGGSRFAIFDSRMHTRAQRRLQLTTDLRIALERDEFKLLYQPIVNISDGTLVGCEALLRWNHPREGTLMPLEFMPLAEQTGLALPIGQFVVNAACKQLAHWKRMIRRQPIFPVNVNVSAAELLDPEFEVMLLRAARNHGIDPADLILEITESVILDPGTRSHTLVERLRGHGFGICIDDFGTGYSSLRYLQQFKVDSIKIDRSFICGRDGEVASEPIVRALLTLAEALEIRVVAEGIETQRQCDLLRTADCRFGQGHLYCSALEEAELPRAYPSAFGLAREARA